ncbi:putative Adenine/guanine permease AZG1 [Cocos nucifera]|uniref:Putative Adenine/guanine permease AZG1 n=1 Tax=Cocos nucifera TaxID=13894 RepID=A0A8K0MWU1_COCNU|nr:putative Adenine/guanine permease AZG1 [Cocos nucifera]
MELHADTATFLTVAYILAINTSILADFGTNYSISDCDNPRQHASSCESMSDVCRDLIIVTTAYSIISSVIMSVLANLPLALAPG